MFVKKIFLILCCVSIFPVFVFAGPKESWNEFRTAYIKKDYIKMYSLISSFDKRSMSLEQFTKKIDEFYDAKIEKIKKLEFVEEKQTVIGDKRFCIFNFVLDGKEKPGGKMILEQGQWKLFGFH